MFSTNWNGVFPTGDSCISSFGLRLNTRKAILPIPCIVNDRLSVSALMLTTCSGRMRLSNKFRQSLFLYNYVMLPKTVWR